MEIYWAILLLLSSSWVIYQTCLSPLSKFPGPFWAKVNPLWHLFQYITGERHKKFKHLHEIYGDIVRIGINELSVCNVEASKEIYGQSSTFLKAPAYKAIRKDSRHPSIASETDPIVHSLLKRQLSAAFSSKALDSMEVYIKNNIKTFCNSIRKFGKNGNLALNISNWIYFLTLDVSGDLCFGNSFGSLEDGVAKQIVSCSIRNTYLIGMLMACPGLKQFLWLSPTYLNKARMELGQQLQNKINQRIANQSTRNDFFFYLTNPEMLKKMPQDFCERLTATCMLLIVAGSDSTATVLVGAIYLLATHDKVFEKLRRELIERFPDPNCDIEHRKIAGLPYLNAVIEETMRVYPPGLGPLPRICSQESVVAGHRIPPNCVISTALYAISRDPRYFTKSESFIPERWIDPEFERDQTLGNLAFQPFSLGPRGCLGRNMAYMEIRLFLAHFVLQFRPELEDPKYSYENLDQWTAFKPPLFMKFSSLKASPA